MKNIVLFSVLIFCLLIEGATTPTYGMKRQMEALDRGLVAAKTENGFSSVGAYWVTKKRQPLMCIKMANYLNQFLQNKLPT